MKKNTKNALKDWIWERLGLHLEEMWDLSWTSLGGFWLPRGCFDGVQNQNLFKTLVHDVPQEAFWIDYEWIWEDAQKDLGQS